MKEERGIENERTGSGRVPAAARQQLILDILQRTGFVAVAQVAGQLGVSEMTARRDLQSLEEQGLIDRTYGGALRREVFDAEEPAFERRRRTNAPAKAAIAAAAATLVRSGETIGLDVGTTALALAEQLVARSDLRIFTNNLRAVSQLSSSRSPVYVPGGQVRDSELSIIGAPAVAQIKSYYFDRVFIGVSGVIAGGCYDYSIEDTEVKRAFIAQAEQVVVLCDSSKFEHRSLASVCSLQEVNVLVSDAAPPPDLAKSLAASDVEILVTSEDRPQPNEKE